LSKLEKQHQDTESSEFELPNLEVNKSTGKKDRLSRAEDEKKLAKSLSETSIGDLEIDKILLAREKVQLNYTNLIQVIGNLKSVVATEKDFKKLNGKREFEILLIKVKLAAHEFNDENLLEMIKGLNTSSDYEEVFKCLNEIEALSIEICEKQISKLQISDVKQASHALDRNPAPTPTPSPDSLYSYVTEQAKSSSGDPGTSPKRSKSFDDLTKRVKSKAETRQSSQPGTTSNKRPNGPK